MRVIRFVNKPFNQQSFNQNDVPARQAIKAFYAKRNQPLEDNADRFGVDLVGNDNSFMVEVEIRTHWNGAKYPYQKVNVLERKKAMLLNNNVSLMVLNADCSQAVCIEPNVLRKYLVDANRKVKRCNCGLEGFRDDYIYEIPLEECKKVTLN